MMNTISNKNIILRTESSKDYELLDSGEGEKLERFGNIVLSRPDPQALWCKNLNVEEWKKADALFVRDDKGGDWIFKNNVPKNWSIEFGDLKFWIKPTPFKHVGIFPEQLPNWEWVRSHIIGSIGSKIVSSTSPTTLSCREPSRDFADTFPRGLAARGDLSRGNVVGEVGETVPKGNAEILNLFAYTGGATLACAQAGAKVVHVDGSKSAIAWARENAELSGLKDKPVRWILDDARTFVHREIKRGRKYSGIIMDPPAFGHGPDNEVWKIEEDLLSFIESCFELLSDKPLFFLVNGYASGYSAIAYENILAKLVDKYGGKIESGELTIEESKNGRLLPCGIFARWSAIVD
jgi:23S rRNA (cytosine1962-C5)-methyltransferase